MTKFSTKLKKNYYWPIFGQFSPVLGQNKFFQKITKWASNTMLSFTQKMRQSQENFWMEGWKDGQTLICRTLLYKAGGPKNGMMNNY